MKTHITWLDVCGSTNAVLADMPDAPAGTVVATRCQTEGRGQRGASWEAEPGANLTFSQLFRPEALPAARQFELSMLVSLAVTDTVDALFEGAGLDIRSKIKWPNDIYVGDGKIAGILIENKLRGAELHRSIAGIGLNVNQLSFLSDAPNPVSIKQLTSIDTPLEPLLEALANRLADYVDNYDGDTDALKTRYMSRLYRGDGRDYTFALPDGTHFEAAITDIDLDGTLHLSDGNTYAFKEVAYVL
ncbi:MAG: biotin--[acetyl-CoA-carboxylase] ligase [Muribaculaceae bacterium]